MSQRNSSLKTEFLKGMRSLRSTKGDEAEKEGSGQEKKIQRIAASKKHLNQQRIRVTLCKLLTLPGPQYFQMQTEQ